MEYPVKTISQLRPFLQGFRKEAGYTQAQIAELLDITQQRYAKLEARPESVSLDQLMKVFQLLGVELVLNKDTHRVEHRDRGETPEDQPSPSVHKDVW